MGTADAAMASWQLQCARGRKNCQTISMSKSKVPDCCERWAVLLSWRRVGRFCYKRHRLVIYGGYSLDSSGRMRRRPPPSPLPHGPNGALPKTCSPWRWVLGYIPGSARPRSPTCCCSPRRCCRTCVHSFSRDMLIGGCLCPQAAVCTARFLSIRITSLDPLHKKVLTCS